MDVVDLNSVSPEFRGIMEEHMVPLRANGDQVNRGRGWSEVVWGDLATLEYGKSLRGYETSTGPYRVYGTNGGIGGTVNHYTPMQV